MQSFVKCYQPFVGPFDPCPPLRVKYYSTPPNLYVGFQPYGLQQFPPHVALRKGTLWPVFFDPYFNPYEQGKEA